MTEKYRQKLIKLSPRERDVLDVIITGVSSLKAADKLCIDEKTVKFHLTNIYKKLGLKSRAEMIVEYYVETQDQNTVRPKVTRIESSFIPPGERLPSGSNGQPNV